MPWPPSKKRKTAKTAVRRTSSAAKRTAAKPAVRSSSRAAVKLVKVAGDKYRVQIGSQFVTKPMPKGLAEGHVKRLKARKAAPAPKKPTAARKTHKKRNSASTVKRVAAPTKTAVRPGVKKNPLPTTVKISDIVASNGEQTLDETIAKLRAEKKAGKRRKRSNRPIEVIRSARSGKYILTDGFHRTAAAIIAGRDKIRAIVRAAKPKRNPTPLLHVVEVGPRTWAVMLGKHVVQKYKTRVGAEGLLKKIRSKARPGGRVPNPDPLSMFANLAVGTASTMQIHDWLTGKKRKTKKRTVRSSSPRKSNAGSRTAKAGGTRAKNPTPVKRNPDTVTAYRTFHQKGLSTAIRFIDRSKNLTAAEKAALKRDLRDYNKPPTIDGRSVGKKANPTRKASKTRKTRPAATKRKRRANPTDFEKFQGRRPDKDLILHGPLDMPANTWTLGQLAELRLPGRTPLNFEKGSEKFYLLGGRGNRLWIAGSKTGLVRDADPSLAPMMVYPDGEISHVCYHTQKTKFDDTAPVYYEHKFGEEGGVRPLLAFDRDGFAHIVGGDFTITPDGIRD